MAKKTWRKKIVAGAFSLGIQTSHTKSKRQQVGLEQKNKTKKDSENNRTESKTEKQETKENVRQYQL